MTSILFIDGGGPAEAAFMGLSPVTASFVSSHLFPAMNFGDEASGRKIIAAVHFLSATGVNPQISSATIGGVAASLLPGLTQGVTGGDIGVKLIGAEVVSGAAGNIAITFTSNVFCRIAVFRALNLSDLAATDSGPKGWTNTLDSPQATDADVEPGGLFLAASHSRMDAGSVTLSGVPTSYDDLLTTDPDRRIIGGLEVLSAAQLAKAASLARTGGSGVWDGALVAASFR